MNSVIYKDNHKKWFLLRLYENVENFQLNIGIATTLATICGESFATPIRSSHQKCSVEKVFLEISQNSQENSCVRVLFMPTLFKKRLWHRCFPVNFAKYLRTPFLQNTSRRQRLSISLLYFFGEGPVLIFPKMLSQN